MDQFLDGIESAGVGSRWAATPSSIRNGSKADVTHSGILGVSNKKHTTLV